MNPNSTPSGAPPAFGSFQANPTTTVPGFGLTAPSSTPNFGSTGFSFGSGSTSFGTGGSGIANTQFGGGLGKVGTTGFGTPTPKPTTTPGSVSFNLPPATGTSPGFNLTAPSNPTPSTGFTFGTSGANSFASPAAITTSALPNPTTTVAPISTGFNLGQSLSSASTTVGVATTTPAFSGFSIAPVASSAATTLNPASSTSAQLSLALSTTTNTTAPTTSATSFGLGNLSTTTVPTIATSTAESASTTSAAKSSVNFAEMDDTIHKWTLELVELEQTFLNQMDQVRDWDRLLLSTGDKIVSLNDSMQKVKLRQQQLDHELDFIVAQQRELVECLLPLEKEFADITVSDPERNSIYQRAENLNTQLQQVSGDLKGVIEHINERNRSQDTTDPIVQIGRILNAHMNSLQWVDQNTAVIQLMLDQIGKMKDIHRRDVDSTQNL